CPDDNVMRRIPVRRAREAATLFPHGQTHDRSRWIAAAPKRLWSVRGADAWRAWRGLRGYRHQSTLHAEDRTRMGRQLGPRRGVWVAFADRLDLDHHDLGQ